MAWPGTNDSDGRKPDPMQLTRKLKKLRMGSRGAGPRPPYIPRDCHDALKIGASPRIERCRRCSRTMAILRSVGNSGPGHLAVM